MTTASDVLPPRRTLLQRIRASFAQLAPPDDSVRKFFSLPYGERVAEIKRLYSHETKKQQLGSWIQRDLEEIKREHRENPRFYIDVVAGYAKTVAPRVFMQLGSFVMTECQSLALDGFPGRLVASDYDPRHLAYLERSFAFPPLDRIEYRVVDLEESKAADFADVDMIGALAVLSNIQPEGLNRFFTALAESSVRCLVLSDMYVKEALTNDPELSGVSYPMPHSRNWSHPYQALASRHGFASLFLPDFTYSSFLEARGIFIACRGLTDTDHADALGHAMRRYVPRQENIWRAYAQRDLKKPQITTLQAPVKGD